MFIGTIVGWDIPDISSTKLHQILKSLHIAPAVVNNSVVRCAFKAICSHLKVDEGKLFLQQLDAKRWVVVHQSRDSSREAVETPLLYLDINTKNYKCSLTVSRSAPASLSLALQSFILPDRIKGSFLGVAIAQEMRRYAIPVRRAGGAYFVPRIFQERADEILKLIEFAGGSVYRFYCTGQPEEQKTIFDSLKIALGEEFSMIRERIASAKRAKTLESLAAEEIPQLIERLDIYSDLLSIYSEQIEKMKKSAEQALRQTLEQAFAKIEKSSLFKEEEANGN